MNKTYHLTLQAKLLSTLWALCTILFTCILFFGAGIIRDPIGWFNQIRFIDGSSALWLLTPCILLLFLCRMMFLAARQSVSLGATALIVNQPNDPRAPLSKKILYQTVEYQNIIRVIYYRQVGSLYIFSRTHPVKVVSIGWYENKEELLAVLPMLIGDRFVDKTGIGLYFGAQIINFLAALLFCFSTMASKPFHVSLVWEPVLHASAFFHDVQTFSLDEDGRSVWIIDEPILSDHVQVWKISGHDVQVWRGLREDYTGMYVSHDDNGNPVVIKEKAIIHWDAGDWKAETTETENFHIWQAAYPLVDGSQFWGTKTRTIVGRDFVADTTRVLESPNPDHGFIENFRLNPDGSLLVEIEKDGEAYLNAYKGNTWLEPGYYLGQVDYWRDPVDFLLDAEGAPWVLREFILDNKVQYKVGYYSSQQADWEWISLAPYSSEDDEYDGLEVDHRGRLWLHGNTDTIHAFIRVFTVLNGELSQLVEYNEYNSGLDFGINSMSLMLGPDGKMWVGGNTVGYIDANSPKLPKPLPDWWAALGNLTVRFGILLLMLVSAIVMSIARSKDEKYKF